jgi:hypothetical protein
MRNGRFVALALLCCLPLLTLAVPVRSAPRARMWDLVRSPAWDLTVRSVERRVDPVMTPDGVLVRPAGRFAIFRIDLTNRTSTSLAPQAADFVLRTADGARPHNLTDAPAARSLALAADLTPFGPPISPGATATTVLLFDLDAHSGHLTLHFLPANQPIQIDECKCNLPSPV